MSSVTAYRPMPRQSLVAREGYPFIGISLICMFILWMSGIGVGAALALFAAVFIACFFRNPERRAPEGPGLVVAPADGRVIKVERGVSAPHTGTRSLKLSIFMSVMNVHINRFPVAAKVKRVIYSAGKFFVASLDKSSDQNERNALILEDEIGREIVMVQIAGIIARRVVCYAREGDFVPMGMRFGLIRFGSRVDLYLPMEIKIDVNVGDKVKAGESVIGRF